MAWRRTRASDSARSACTSTSTTDASADQIATLLKLTERYCVVFQTLRQPPEVRATVTSRLTGPATGGSKDPPYFPGLMF